MAVSKATQAAEAYHPPPGPVLTGTGPQERTSSESTMDIFGLIFGLYFWLSAIWQSNFGLQSVLS